MLIPLARMMSGTVIPVPPTPSSSGGGGSTGTLGIQKKVFCVNSTFKIRSCVRKFVKSSINLTSQIKYNYLFCQKMISNIEHRITKSVNNFGFVLQKKQFNFVISTGVKHKYNSFFFVNSISVTKTLNIVDTLNNINNLKRVKIIQAVNFIEDNNDY